MTALATLLLLAAPGPRVYCALVDTREHPDYDRRHVQPPGWDTFGGRTHLVTLRGFAVDDGKIEGYAGELDRYTRDFELGDVVWPSYPIVFADNLADLAQEIKRRDLFLFDIWGFVPGSGPGGYWQQFKPPVEALRTLDSVLGERWLGMDVGEQDGRYVGGYAPGGYPIGDDRVAQYLRFQRHFERMCDDLGNRMSALVSLNFGHYFLKEGVYTLIGAETAQALPNSQVYYSFIRGAGKQYGVLWFGNASVFNRWGFKAYGGEGSSDGYAYGPTHGTSLNLLKRLMYTHILYNSALVGFESGWFDGDKLSPIGEIQQGAGRFIREYGSPGTMMTPVALLLDFDAGWTFPRHLYSGEVYRVWGTIPYGPGDYLTHGVLDMIYPGYEAASYYHDETGFMVPTPYGDCADSLLSDAPLWVLERYPLLIAAGELSGGAELRDKLAGYVRGGGHLVITAGNAARLPGGLGGIGVTGPAVRQEAGALGEEQAFDLLPLSLPAGAVVTLECGGLPAVADMPLGAGRVTVLGSPFGLAGAAGTARVASEVDRPLPNPYPLLRHVREALDRALTEQVLFEVGEGLSLVTCRRGPGEYTLGVCNNSLSPRPFAIESRIGPVESAEEVPIDRSEMGDPGYVPLGFEGADLGVSGPDVIAGGDTRVFHVRLASDATTEIPHVVPPGRPRARALPLRGVSSIEEEILRRPTFFEHFDGVSVDWRYLHERESAALTAESGWLSRQGVRVFVDLTSGIDLYPDLRLVNNVAEDYSASMAAIDDVIDKMPSLGARDLIVCLHRQPENNMSAEDWRASLTESLRAICVRAGERGVTVHLRVTQGRVPGSLGEAIGFMDMVGRPELRLAPSVALVLAEGLTPEQAKERLSDRIGLWLAGAPAWDAAGHLWTSSARLAEWPDAVKASDLMASIRDVPVVLDGVYRSRDEEYADARRCP